VSKHRYWPSFAIQARAGSHWIAELCLRSNYLLNYDEKIEFYEYTPKLCWTIPTS
jgi:hypothetical protein